MHVGAQIRVLHFAQNNFSGTMQFAFQHHFLDLDLSENNFSGEINFRGLWSNELKSINLSHNGFTSVDFLTYPSIQKFGKVVQLDLSFNILTGTLDLSAINNTAVRFLDASHNNLSETIDLSGVAQLNFLDLSWNRFSGTLNFDALAQSIVSMSIGNNSFCGGVAIRRPGLWCRSLASRGACEGGEDPIVVCPNSTNDGVFVCPTCALSEQRPRATTSFSNGLVFIMVVSIAGGCLLTMSAAFCLYRRRSSASESNQYITSYEVTLHDVCEDT